MGSVWIARNDMTQAEVAVKVLRLDRIDDPLALERFRHEAKVGATLAHRNITRVFDLVEEDDSLILVMELLRGETLEARTERGVLDNEEAVAIMVPILRALEHAHEHGIVHRDVKPSNVFLHVDPDGHVIPKLLDFGIAKEEDSSIHTKTGEALGTPYYMSPEQVRAEPLDGRSDLFAVGSILYELITGETAFRAPSVTASLARVLEAEIDPTPAIAPRVWLEIARALSKRPYERHANAGDFARALAAAVALGEVALTERIRRQPPPRQTRSETVGSLPPQGDGIPGGAVGHDSPTVAAVRSGENLELALRPRFGRSTVIALAASLIAVFAVVLVVVELGRASHPRHGETSAAGNGPATTVVATTGSATTADGVAAPPAVSPTASALVEASGRAGLAPSASGAPHAPIANRTSPTSHAATPGGEPAKPAKPTPPAPTPSANSPRDLARTPGF